MCSYYFSSVSVAECPPFGKKAAHSVDRMFSFVFFFLIQFNVPFKIISLIETSQWVGGAKREYPGKTT